jgi:hypothetical protein
MYLTLVFSHLCSHTCVLTLVFSHLCSHTYFLTLASTFYARLMAAEDKLGKAMRQQYIEEARGVVGTKMAKKYKKEMDKRRVEVDLEHQMERESVERATLRGKRQGRVDALKKQYEASEIHLSGDDLGYGLDATIADLSPVQDGCDRLCKDMTEIRGRKKEAMERHEATVKKREDMERRVGDIERKLRVRRSRRSLAYEYKCTG